MFHQHRADQAGGATAPLRSLPRLLAALAAVATLLLGVAPEAAAKPSNTAYIVVDAHSGHVLRANRSKRLRHPASLTKMMTLYLTFEALEARRLRPNQVLTASQHAADMPPSELGLKRGDKITVRDAIRSAAVRSANDSAVVLAEALGGSETAFARLMTRKARELGMMDTTFKNASGLTSKGHLSTARDMAILAQRLHGDFGDYYHLFSKKKIRALGRTHRATNSLLGASRGVDGIKTGYTRAAGYNLAASARRKGRRLIVVLLGGSTRVKRDQAVKALLDDGFERLEKRETQGLLVATRTAPRPSLRPTREPERAEMREVAAAARSGAGRLIRGSLLNGWSVQVGAFLDPAKARSRLQDILTMKAPGLASGFRKTLAARLDPKGDAPVVTVHRARFTGLSETDARRACRHLKGERIDCALVPPVGWDDASLVAQ